MSIYISLAVCLIGLVILLIGPEPAPNPWPRKHMIAYAMFWCGLVAFLFQVPQLLTVLGK
jgi:hypothetical protein